jgi:hypothetical protein
VICREKRNKIFCWIYGSRRTARITRGIVLRVVRKFSVIPDGRTPLALRRQNMMSTRISTSRILPTPKKETYCPIPAAIVAIPNIEDIKYNMTSVTEVFLPNTFDSIE